MKDVMNYIKELGFTGWGSLALAILFWFIAMPTAGWMAMTWFVCRNWDEGWKILNK